MGDLTAEVAISDAHYRSSAEYERSSKQFLRSMVPPAPKLNILDVGCGTGLNSSHFAKAGHRVYGVDISPVAIERYCEHGFDGSVVDLDRGPLPVPSAAFDLVYASEVIEHCKDTSGFLRELHRALKPGGKLLLSTPNSAFWPYRLLALWGRTPTECQHPGHIRFFSKRGLTRAIAEAGFTVTEVAARHMYMIVGAALGDRLAPVLYLAGFRSEPRFATGDHFWQLSRFARRASALWADTLLIIAEKPVAPRAAEPQI